MRLKLGIEKKIRHGTFHRADDYTSVMQGTRIDMDEGKWFKVGDGVPIKRCPSASSKKVLHQIYDTHHFRKRKQQN